MKKLSSLFMFSVLIFLMVSFLKYDRLIFHYLFADSSDSYFDNIVVSNKPMQDFHLNFSKTCKIQNASQELIFKDDSEFNELVEHYKKVINTVFTPSHLEGLSEIAVYNAEVFVDNSGAERGSCAYCMGKTYISIAGYSAENDFVLLHEICHAMQFRYKSIFNEIKKDWENCDEYVSDYSRTNIDEDFAETGAHYLFGERDESNIKFKLFERFFNKIKDKNTTNEKISTSCE